MNKSENEIDLIELFRNIVVGIYSFFKRRSKFLYITFGTGVFAGAVLFVINKDKMEYRFTGFSDIIPSEVSIQVINSLNQIIENNKKKAADLLHLNEKDADKLMSINADTLKSIIVNKKKTIAASKIEVTFKKGFNTDGLVQKIKGYLDSNKFIAKELAIEKEQSRRLVEKYDGIIKRLEEFQDGIINTNQQPAETEGELLVINNQSQDFHHADLIELEEKKQAEQKKLERITAFSLISDDGIRNKTTLGENMGYGITIFMGIGFIMCILLELRRYAQTQEKLKSKESIKETPYIEKERQVKAA